MLHLTRGIKKRDFIKEKGKKCECKSLSGTERKVLQTYFPFLFIFTAYIYQKSIDKFKTSKEHYPGQFHQS